MQMKVGIFIFDDVEVLDFAGPFEVFSRTRTVAGADSRRTDDSAPFRTFTVARTSDVITAIGGLKVVERHGRAISAEDFGGRFRSQGRVT